MKPPTAIVASVVISTIGIATAGHISTTREHEMATAAFVVHPPSRLFRAGSIVRKRDFKSRQSSLGDVQQSRGQSTHRISSLSSTPSSSSSSSSLSSSRSRRATTLGIWRGRGRRLDGGGRRNGGGELGENAFLRNSRGTVRAGAGASGDTTIEDQNTRDAGTRTGDGSVIDGDGHQGVSTTTGGGAPIPAVKGDDGDGKGEGKDGTTETSPPSLLSPSSSSKESYAEAARRRLKRARGALEDALDVLGRSAVDDLGLAPPAYMDLHLNFPGDDDDTDDDDQSGDMEGVDSGAEGKEGGSGEQGDGVGWMRQWKKRGITQSIDGPDGALAEMTSSIGEAVEGKIEEVEDSIRSLDKLGPDEGLSEFGSSLGEAMEERIEAVGESILALDERVERARASVETALNELGLAVPSDIGVLGEGRSGEDADGDDMQGSGTVEVGGPLSMSEKGAARPGKRWWLPERMRSNLEDADMPANSTGTATSSIATGLDEKEDRQRDRASFFKNSLPLPSIQSQRAVAERAVKRAKDVLGSAMDDLGLTRPPVGSTLERFLHADEILGLWQQEEELEEGMPDGDDILPGTDIGTPDRRIWVVTTAALPWMTGTSVNPLLRAAYLSRGRESGKVSLMIPWLKPEDQHFVLPDGSRFENQEEQEVVIRDWLRKAGMKTEANDLDIAWYDARYHQIAGCIFPMGDITRLIPDDEADVCIMEEPEHLNWFRATGVNWSKKFTHVVGVIHTNYIHYTMADTTHWASGRVKAPFARAFNKIMARAYCDKVIKLSATLQKFAEEKETVTNVHGVRENFLLVGDQRNKDAAKGKAFEEGGRPYFLGKMLWEKGYDKLWDLLKGYQDAEAQGDGKEGAPDNRGGDDNYAVLAAYGSGPDSDEIKERADEMGLAIKFEPATDHAELAQYKTFVNPSQSEVLCTTVAEALAMGKFVIIAEHASNEFFYQFPNTLKFKTQEDFNEQMKYSIENDPTPLSSKHRHVLGWDAATKRLIESAKVTLKEARRRRRELDEAAWLFHYYLGSGRRGDRVRKIMAGGVVAGQNAHMELVKKEEDKARQEAEGDTVTQGAGSGVDSKAKATATDP